MNIGDDIHSFVQRLSVDFSSIVVDDEDDCPSVSTGRMFSCIVRIAVGPPRIVAGKPTKRGIRFDSWVGMTTEPDAEKYEGVSLDDGNEIILTKGETAMIKLPNMDGDEICAFPGLGFFLEWTNIPDSRTNQLHIMSLCKMPFYMMRMSTLNAQGYSQRPCSCGDCSTSFKPKVPDFVPKIPPEQSPPPPATPQLAIEERRKSAKRMRPVDN